MSLHFCFFAFRFLWCVSLAGAFLFFSGSWVSSSGAGEGSSGSSRSEIGAGAPGSGLPELSVWDLDCVLRSHFFLSGGKGADFGGPSDSEITDLLVFII